MLTATRVTGEAATTVSDYSGSDGTGDRTTQSARPGTFTINKALATVTTTNNSKTYGTADPPLVATQSGFLPGRRGAITLSATRAPGGAATTM